MKKVLLVSALALAGAVSGLAQPGSARAADVNYVNNQSMGGGSLVWAQPGCVGCFASRTYNLAFRPNLAAWSLVGTQSGTGWTYIHNSWDYAPANPVYVTTGSNRWPIKAGCSNQTTGTKLNITCATDY